MMALALDLPAGLGASTTSKKKGDVYDLSLARDFFDDEAFRKQDQKAQIRFLEHLCERLGHYPKEKGYMGIAQEKEDPKKKFELLDVIGAGAFGKIYTAKPTVERQLVAIKVLPIEKGNKDLNTKLDKEIAILKRAKRCNQIVQYYGSSISSQRHMFKEGNFLISKNLWIIMEYCDLGSMSSYIDKQKHPLSEPLIRCVMKQLISALVFLHSLRVVHRDVKAANILWNSKGECKLADLGEAVTLTDDKPYCDDMAGTPYFMPPEIPRGDQYNTKADIWSAAVTAIELAEMHPPNHGMNPMRVIFLLATEDKPPSLTKQEQFSAEFKDFLAKCFVEQGQRPTAEQLAKHPWIAGADDNQFAEFAKEWKEKKEQMKKEQAAAAEAAKSSSADITPRSVDTLRPSMLAVAKDPATGETLEEFLERVLNWKEANKETLMKFAESITSAESKSSPDMLRSARHSRSLSSLPRGNQKELEKWDVLVHLAALISHPFFGVIVIDRTVQRTFYANSFLGKECVDWLYENLRFEKRTEAIHIAVHLVRSHLFTGITTNDHYDVDSEHSVYRFNKEKISEWVTGDLTQQLRTSKVFPLKETKEKEAGTLTQTDKAVIAMTTTATELTERDWQLILSGSSVQSFKKDDVVVEQGSYNRSLYRVKKGSVRVEKIDRVGANQFTTTVLASMGAGAMFGEMSVLTKKGKTSATIRADATPTEIYRAEVSFMYRLFKTEPGMQQRFFKSASRKLAGKLREVGAQKEPASPRITPASSKDTVSPSLSTVSAAAELLSSVSDRDRRFQELFDLPVDEVIIQEYPCYVKGFIKEHGVLYVSRNHVSFFAKVFGKRTKVSILIHDIKHTEVPDKRSLVVKTKKKQLSVNGLFDAEATHSIISSLRDTSQTQEEEPQGGETPRRNSEVDYEEEILTSDDWSVLLAEAQVKKYKNNEVIVKEGEWALKIFQIGKGSCRVEKVMDGVSRTLGRMESGEIFGEISFLEGGRTSATIVSAEETEIYAIEGARLKVLFMRHPALSGRFFQYLASILSHRLKDREAAFYSTPSSPSLK